MKESARDTGYLTAWISRSALQHNLRLLRAQLQPTTKICGVAKADCYGHGWEACLGTIAEQVDYLAVATLEEAANVALRSYGPNILAFSVPAAASQKRLVEVIHHDVVLTITCEADLLAVSSAASAVGKPARVHVKVDSGMARSGIWHAGAAELIKRVRAQSEVQLTGLYTHFASADETDKQPTHDQFDRFMQIVEAVGGRDELLLHASNSAATIDLPEYQLDMVRPGIAMYGYQPSSEMATVLELRPILRLTGRLVAIKQLPAGTKVGYGRSYTLPVDSTLGLVQVGYADGYQRAFSNRATMALRGSTVPVRGRVSMDQTVVDISKVTSAAVGDEIEIVSPNPDAPNSVASLAAIVGAIPYEIMCSLGDRIDRVVVQ